MIKRSTCFPSLMAFLVAVPVVGVVTFSREGDVQAQPHQHATDAEARAAAAAQQGMADQRAYAEAEMVAWRRRAEFERACRAAGGVNCGQAQRPTTVVVTPSQPQATRPALPGGGGGYYTPNFQNGKHITCGPGTKRAANGACECKYPAAMEMHWGKWTNLQQVVQTGIVCNYSSEAEEAKWKQYEEDQARSRKHERRQDDAIDDNAAAIAGTTVVVAEHSDVIKNDLKPNVDWLVRNNFGGRVVGLFQLDVGGTGSMYGGGAGIQFSGRTPFTWYADTRVVVVDVTSVRAVGVSSVGVIVGGGAGMRISVTERGHFPAQWDPKLGIHVT